jgi:hypothetical protein
MLYRLGSDHDQKLTASEPLGACLVVYVFYLVVIEPKRGRRTTVT